MTVRLEFDLFLINYKYDYRLKWMTQSSVTNNQYNYNKIYYVLSDFKTKSALVSALVPLVFFNFQENTNSLLMRVWSLFSEQ